MKVSSYTVRSADQAKDLAEVPKQVLQLNPIGSGLFERTAGPGGGVGHHAFGPPRKDP